MMATPSGLESKVPCLQCTVSIPLYGRGNPSLGDDPSHTGIAIHLDKSSPATCYLHHVSCPMQTRYIYDPRPEQPLSSDTVLWGRCELVSGLSPVDATRVTAALAAFGNEEKNLLEWNAGNCQDWMAGAVCRLEAEGLVASGEGAFWRSCIGVGAEDVSRRCVASGRRWVEGERKKPEVVDRRWGDEEGRTVGRLTSNNALSARVGVLKELLGS